MPSWKKTVITKAMIQPLRQGWPDLGKCYPVNKCTSTSLLAERMRVVKSSSRLNVSSQYPERPYSGGFDRVAFKQACEASFDELFQYPRSIEESFQYYNTLKNGKPSDRVALLAQVKQSKIASQPVSEQIRSEVISEEAKQQIKQVPLLPQL